MTSWKNCNEIWKHEIHCVDEVFATVAIMVPFGKIVIFFLTYKSLERVGVWSPRPSPCYGSGGYWLSWLPLTSEVETFCHQELILRNVQDSNCTILNSWIKIAELQDPKVISIRYYRAKHFIPIVMPWPRTDFRFDVHDWAHVTKNRNQGQSWLRKSNLD